MCNLTVSTEQAKFLFFQLSRNIFVLVEFLTMRCEITSHYWYQQQYIVCTDPSSIIASQRLCCWWWWTLNSFVRCPWSNIPDGQTDSPICVKYAFRIPANTLDDAMKMIHRVSATCKRTIVGTRTKSLCCCQGLTTNFEQDWKQKTTHPGCRLYWEKCEQRAKCQAISAVFRPTNAYGELLGVW